MKRKYNLKLTFFVIFILSIIPQFSAKTFGEVITPDQVLIIANSEVKDSVELAKFYAGVRGIPTKNILLLPMKNQEEISRDYYDNNIAKPIRSFLTKLKLANKIKIMVTMYGVPLKISDSLPSTNQRQLANEIKQKYYSVFSKLENNYVELIKLSGKKPNEASTLPARDNIEKLNQNLQPISLKIQKQYQSIILKLQQMKSQEQQNETATKFAKINFEIEGNLTLAQTLLAQKRPEANQLVEDLKIKQNEFDDLNTLNLETLEPEKYKTKYKLAFELGGLLLELRTLRYDYGCLMQTESKSAVDSELSLVLWDDYPLAGRMPNGLNPRFTTHPIVTGKKPTLMVSRLDGPNPKIVRRVILESFRTEKSGLTGNAFIDARGIRARNGFSAYDDNLRKLASLLKRKTHLMTTLDDSPKLFARGKCPRTAIYCGWYSLRNYIHAFDFLAGSVGYHIASFEATTLKSSKSNQWVKRMLEHGIAATLGAVDEPYLDAFPLPTEFFTLLMTGNYTLAEVFYKTKRYNSWRMILIGDPLYTPFKAKPELSETDVELGPLNLLLIN